ncbi:MAG: tetraacyldisaccharide 4'-kinase [Thermodesulfovibrionales bacterium]
MGPLEFLYYSGYCIKKSNDRRKQKRLPRRVISVGNLTYGGTGKTPAVIAIAEDAKKAGYQPCILTRGYKGRARGPCFISRGAGALLGVEEAGDEAVLMAERLKGVPIVKCADRYKGGMFAISELPSQHPLLFILDDGFQHLRLYRDVDILLIDGTNPFGNRRLIPSGILREPLTEMKRADLIVITKVSDSEKAIQSLIDEIRGYNPDKPIFLAEHRPVGLRTISGETLPPDFISGRAVLGFCAIGNPASFRGTLLRIGAELKGFMSFRDHFMYSQQDIFRISEAAGRCRADWIVTTEKDIIKMKGIVVPENLLSLCIEFDVDRRFYEEILQEG